MFNQYSGDTDWHFKRNKSFSNEEINEVMGTKIKSRICFVGIPTYNLQ